MQREDRPMSRILTNSPPTTARLRETWLRGMWAFRQVLVHFVLEGRVEEAVLRLGSTRFCLQPLQFFPRTELQFRHFSGAEVAHPDLSSAIHRDRL